MANKSNYKIPFHDLIVLLKLNEIDITINQITEIQSYFLTTPLKESSLENLKYILTPIIAKNADSQELIYKVIDNYLKDLNYAPEIDEYPNKIIPRIGNYLLKLIRAISKRISKILEKGFTWRYMLIFPLFLAFISIAGIPDRPKIKVETADKAEYVDVSLIISLVLGTFCGIILSYFLFKKKKTFISDNHINQVISREYNVPYVKVYRDLEWNEPYELGFQNNNFLILKSREMASIKNSIENQMQSDILVFDVKRSIQQTCLNAGFHSPVFTNESENDNFLILINNRDYQSHMLGLFDFFIETITKGKKRLAKYYFYRSIKVIKPVKGRSLLINDIIEKKGSYNLIILGDCIDLFDEDRESISQEVLEVQKLVRSISIITPPPLLDWSYSETDLQKAGFNIVPAEIEAIELLIGEIFQDHLTEKGHLFKKVKDIYSCSNFDFESIDDLKGYLNDDYLFQIVCSLAVYPELRWEVTICLFSGIIDYLKERRSYAKIKLDYNTLLKLSRISWLKNNQLSDNLRRELLENLNNDMEEVARVTILDMLKDLKKVTPRTSLAFKELQTQFNINAFILFVSNEKKYGEYAYTKTFINSLWTDLDDWALKDYIDKSTNSLMPKDIRGNPLSVEGFIDKEKKARKKRIVETEITKITVGALLFLLIPPITIYYSGKILHASWTYSEVNNATVAIKNRPCNVIPKNFAVDQYIEKNTVPLSLYPDENNEYRLQGVYYDIPIKMNIRIENWDTTDP